MGQKKILICDDHSLFGFGVQSILEKHGYIVNVFLCSADCISEIQKCEYDVLFLDINIDERSGFDIFNEVKDQLKETKAFLLSAYNEPYLVEKCKQFGFNGYLRKETATEDLIKAIEMSKSDSFFNPTNDYTRIEKQEFKDGFSARSVKLSAQEKKIIQLVVLGGTSKSIAEELFISKSTVDTHRRNIYRKLEITGISSLIQFANENLPTN